jgi:hypothetical protein
MTLPSSSPLKYDVKRVREEGGTLFERVFGHIPGALW